MSFAPGKSVGDARYASQIHSFIVPYNLDSNLYKECVLSTSNATADNVPARALVEGFLILSFLQRSHKSSNSGNRAQAPRI